MPGQCPTCDDPCRRSDWSSASQPHQSNPETWRSGRLSWNEVLRSAGPLQPVESSRPGVLAATSWHLHRDRHRVRVRVRCDQASDGPILANCRLRAYIRAWCPVTYAHSAPAEMLRRGLRRLSELPSFHAGRFFGNVFQQYLPVRIASPRNVVAGAASTVFCQRHDMRSDPSVVRRRLLQKRH